ncbi:MAG: hypothetical protein HZB16_08235 [Armatimonadetes bacterium]|nr:hypothetical protein [Armatimonadota bacterium]
MLRILSDGRAVLLSPPQPSARRLSCSRGGRVAAWLAGPPGHTQLWVRPADGSPAAAWVGLPEDLTDTRVADGGQTLVVTRAGGERLQVNLTDRAQTPAPAPRPVWLYFSGRHSTHWWEAESSPDGRWLAALWGNDLKVAPADEPDRARTLFSAGAQAYGPWLHVARPLEVAP